MHLRAEVPARPPRPQAQFLMYSIQGEAAVCARDIPADSNVEPNENPGPALPRCQEASPTFLYTFYGADSWTFCFSLFFQTVQPLRLQPDCKRTLLPFLLCA